MTVAAESFGKNKYVSGNKYPSLVDANATNCVSLNWEIWDKEELVALNAEFKIGAIC